MFRRACVVTFVLLAAPASSQDGAALYAQRCSMCHDGGVVRAPARRVNGPSVSPAIRQPQFSRRLSTAGYSSGAHPGACTY
jgi:hypothetical protein